ncbi:MAG TPA: DUF4340 domain-containing protein [Steroidobacteraceae bacterium]|jgi:hypothetical protein|nr:DUF4340 domain-containing protein [Steroidobacteraceae bacterium]
MSARRVALLLLVGVALVVFAIWLASQRHLEHATLTGDLVLPGLEHSVNAVSAVDLRRGDGTRATLKRDADGWLVGERAWPAESGRVRKLLLDLGALNVVEEKTRLPANYAQLGVDDVTTPKATGTEIDVVTPGRTFALIVGHTSGGKSGYVRVGGSAASLLAAPLLTPDADPKSWLERSLVDLPVARVREVEAKPADGPGYTATRAKKEDPDFTVAPTPKGRQLTGPGAADSIAAALAGLTLEDVQKGTAPADAKLSHAVYRTFDGLELEVAGRKDGARSLIALTARSLGAGTAAEAQRLNARLSGWEFEVPEYKYGAIFRSLEDLLKPREEPKQPAKKAAGKPPAAGPAKPPGK